MRPTTTRSFFTLAIVILPLIAGCKDVSGSPSTTSGSPTTEAASESRIKTACGPVKIACLQDKTGSSEDGVPQLTLKEVEVLIQMLRRCGGEIGFGLIRDRSNQALLRLRIEAPPAAPPPPAKARNQFKEVENRAAHQKQMQAYEERLRLWQGEADQRIALFRSALEPLLARKANAPKTDVWGGVRRADLFLAESDAAWKQPTHRWAVFITDGKDNARGPGHVMSSNAAVVVVSGGTSNTGMLESLKPLRFEAPLAAFEFIVSSGEKEK